MTEIFDIPTLVSLITALGGYEGWKAWRHRKAEDRKANASASMDEVAVADKRYEGLENYNTFLQAKLNERDAKIDSQYREMRAKDETILMMTAEANISDLSLKEAQSWMCKIMQCSNRKPRLKDVVYDVDEKGNQNEKIGE